MSRRNPLPPPPRPKVYLFGWPSEYGGAGTKVADLLGLMAGDCHWTVIPNDDAQLKQKKWVAWMRAKGIHIARWQDLPARLQGWGLALCNGPWLATGRAALAHGRGLRLIWSSEMMWHHPAELGAVVAGILDTVLFVSPVQRATLGPGYALATDSTMEGGPDAGRCGGLRWVDTGNYVHAEAFPFKDRRRRKRFGGEFVIGRLSRADPAKFPRDFPRSWERLQLENVRYRVMAWDSSLPPRWPHWRPGPHWDLLPQMQESRQQFLSSLDLFVYALGAHCRESWGRSLVEAMLTGAVPLIDGNPRHHLRNLVPHGVAGFHCGPAAEWRHHARTLAADSTMRAQMSRAAADYTRDVLCRPEQHRALWHRVFEG